MEQKKDDGGEGGEVGGESGGAGAADKTAIVEWFIEGLLILAIYWEGKIDWVICYND